MWNLMTIFCSVCRWSLCVLRAENSTGQQQLRESVKLMMPCGVIPQHCMFYTHPQTHTNIHTDTNTQTLHTHTRLLLSTALQLTASLGVVFLSSWLAEIKQDAISLNLLHIFISLPRGSLNLSGTELPTPAEKRPTGTLSVFPHPR